MVDRPLRHPRRAGSPADHPPYPYDAMMPILGQTKRFVTFNETTVCNTEYAPGHFRIVLGISRHDRIDGCAVPMDIPEAEAMIALLQNAIADQRRMEAGLVPFAPLHDPAKPEREH